MYATLLSLAIEIGAPLVRRVLEDRLGTKNGQLVTDVVEAIAERVGVRPAELEDYARSNPDVVGEAISQVEQMTPELLRLMMSETETREALLMAEMDQGGWSAAWRPGWMYLLGFLWLWNLVLLHVLNAIFRIALPPADLTSLLAVTGLFISLYMGGHTVKAVAASLKGR